MQGPEFNSSLPNHTQFTPTINKAPFPFLDLFDHLQLNVILYLPPNDSYHLALTCKALNKLIKDEDKRTVLLALQRLFKRAITAPNYLDYQLSRQAMRIFVTMPHPKCLHPLLAPFRQRLQKVHPVTPSLMELGHARCVRLLKSDSSLIPEEIVKNSQLLDLKSFKATEEDSIEDVIQQMVAGTIDVDTVFEVNEDGEVRESLLMTQVLINREDASIEQFKILLDLGIDINAKVPWTVLNAAIFMRKNAIAKLFLQQDGIDPNPKDREGKTPLARAIFYGNPTLMRANFMGDPTLMQTNINDNNEIVRLLIQNKRTDLNAKEDNVGTTPLMEAMIVGNTVAVEVLVQQDGIDFNEQDKKGRTALMWAIIKGRTESAKLLIKQKERIGLNVKDSDGRTALATAICMSNPNDMRAVIAGVKDNFEIVQLLLQQDEIDLNVKDNEGNTVHKLAKKAGHNGITQLLEKKT